MAQSYPAIASTDTVQDSRIPITDRDDAVKSHFSGTVFPTNDLLIGMTCFRTDVGQLFELEDTTPVANWVLIADLNKTYLPREDADLRFDLKVETQQQTSTFAVATGAGNVFTVAYTPEVTALTIGTRLSFRANHTISDSATIIVDSIAVQNIFKHMDQPTILNDIKNGQIVDLEYDGTDFQMVSPVGNRRPSGTAQTMNGRARTDNTIAPTWPVDAKTGTYTVILGDIGKEIRVNTALASIVNLLPASTAGNGYMLAVRNVGAGDVTIDPSSTELIDGALTLVLRTGEHIILVCNGVLWEIVSGNASAAAVSNLVPSGSVIDFAGATAPIGWVLCDGATFDSVADTSFAALFSAIGIVHGGTDASSFKVPDMRGRVSVGQDNMGGVSANRIVETEAHGVNGDTLGAVGGVGEHQLTVAELAAHTHSILSSGIFGGGSQGGTGNSSSTGATGGDAAHTNLQPSMILNKIIKK